MICCKKLGFSAPADRTETAAGSPDKRCEEERNGIVQWLHRSASWLFHRSTVNLDFPSFHSLSFDHLPSSRFLTLLALSREKKKSQPFPAEVLTFKDVLAALGSHHQPSNLKSFQRETCMQGFHQLPSSFSEESKPIL